MQWMPSACSLRGASDLLKTPLHGKQFANREDILTVHRREVACIDALHTADGIQRLPHRWQRCVDALWDYFEGC